MRKSEKFSHTFSVFSEPFSELQSVGFHGRFGASVSLTAAYDLALQETSSSLGS